MPHKHLTMREKKRIALVAHDNMKPDLYEWATYNKALLERHELFATGTTGTLLERALMCPIAKLQSGPLGGDQQIGAMEPQPHDPDVKALLRIAVVWNIPIACNRASADFIISSPLMADEYERLIVDYEPYKQRLQGRAVPAEGNTRA